MVCKLPYPSVQHEMQGMQEAGNRHGCQSTWGGVACWVLCVCGKFFFFSRSCFCYSLVSAKLETIS